MFDDCYLLAIQIIKLKETEGRLLSIISNRSSGTHTFASTFELLGFIHYCQVTSF